MPRDYATLGLRAAGSPGNPLDMFAGTRDQQDGAGAAKARPMPESALRDLDLGSLPMRRLLSLFVLGGRGCTASCPSHLRPVCPPTAELVLRRDAAGRRRFRPRTGTIERNFFFEMDYGRLDACGSRLLARCGRWRSEHGRVQSSSRWRAAERSSTSCVSLRRRSLAASRRIDVTAVGLPTREALRRGLSCCRHATPATVALGSRMRLLRCRLSIEVLLRGRLVRALDLRSLTGCLFSSSSGHAEAVDDYGR